MPAITKAPIIGFIRYSCRASFDRTGGVFDPAYLKYRLNIFENITLKSFQNQSDMDFHLFLLHSVNLPDEYKEKFGAMEQENTFLHNIYIEDGEIEGKAYVDAVQSSIEYVRFENNVAINFRIDNDDGIPCDYIARLKTCLKEAFADFAICLPHVAIIQRIGKDKYLKQEKQYPANSMGLAYVAHKNDYKTIMTQGDHGRLNDAHPLLLLPGRGGLQTINGNNIMNALDFGRVPAFSGAELRSFFAENKYTDFDCTCLHICKRRQYTKLFIKIIRFIAKQFKGGKHASY